MQKNWTGSEFFLKGWGFIDYCKKYAKNYNYSCSVIPHSHHESLTEDWLNSMKTMLLGIMVIN